MHERPANNFGVAFLLATILAIGTGILILALGKNGTFQLINGNHTEVADQFFKYFTHYGDGIMWAPLGAYCFFYRRKYFIAVIAAVLISTILAQFLKRVVYPEELRPISFLSENFPVHIVEGVRMKKIHSFPSGHATTSFAMALIMSYMINSKIWSVILPLFALLAAYSRVYLAQHFPTDILAGMCIGIVSAILSLIIYRSFNKNMKGQNDSMPRMQSSARVNP
ncbi:MAG TPA: phosphatase PAP2 family protein [Chitinophagaceae bacterium]|nr:phosphatase PAP2 family protein [Chitinophagaceae bacterium]